MAKNCQTKNISYFYLYLCFLFLLGSFITKHLESFPNWLKVVCTVRSGMTSVVKCLPFHQINLDKCSLDERIKKDLVDYIQYRIETSPSIQVNITPVHLVSSSTSVTATSKFLQHQLSNIQDSAGSTAQMGPQERFLQHLTQTSQGNFLFAKLVLDLIGKL